VDLAPISPRDRVKARAVTLALARGLGLVRIGRDVYAVHAGGALSLLARARDGVGPWAIALAMLERGVREVTAP
jgi:hypothetical protein